MSQGRKASAFSSDSEKGSDKEKKSSDDSDNDLSEAEAALKAADKDQNATRSQPAAVLKRHPLQKKRRNMVRART